MSKKFVRSTKDVENIQTLSKNLFDENDIVSTNKSEVYIKSKDDFIKLLLNSDLDEVNKEIKNVITDIDILNKHKESVETSLKTNTEDLKKIKEDVLTTDNKTKENEGKINQNIEDITAINTKINQNIEDIASINTKINKNIDDITAINNKINSSYKLLFEGAAKDVGTSIPLNDDFTKYKRIVISGVFASVPFSADYSTKIITKDITVQQTNVINGEGNGGGNYELLIDKISNTELKISNDVYYDFGSAKGSGANANKFTINYIEGYK